MYDLYKYHKQILLFLLHLMDSDTHVLGTWGTQVISTPKKLLIIFYPSSKPPHVPFHKVCPHTRSNPFLGSSPTLYFYLFVDSVQYGLLVPGFF